MTPEERIDVEQAVTYHYEHGGFADHNKETRSCTCAGCRLVRTFEDLKVTEEVVSARNVDKAVAATLYGDGGLLGGHADSK